jgi:hypothetical protein
MILVNFKILTCATVLSGWRDANVKINPPGSRQTLNQTHQFAGQRKSLAWRNERIMGGGGHCCGHDRAAVIQSRTILIAMKTVVALEVVVPA